MENKYCDKKIARQNNIKHNTYIEELIKIINKSKEYSSN